MEKPYIIQITTEDNLEKEILEMYWRLTDEHKFQFPVIDIAEKYNKKSQEITELAKRASQFDLFCSECGTAIISTKIRSAASNLRDHLVGEKFMCQTCRIQKVKERLPETYEPVVAAMELAIKTESWKKLDAEHLDTLIIIAQCNSRQEVFNWLFKSIPPKSWHSKQIWRRVNLLDSMKLIWTRRNGQHIEEFVVMGELKEILREEYPEKFQEGDVLDIPKDTLKITLLRVNSYAINASQYKGTIILNQTIELPKGTPLYYEGSINDDGTMTLTIIPQYENPEQVDFEYLLNNHSTR